MIKRILVYVGSLFLLSLLFSFILLYFWSRGVDVLRVVKGRNYLLESTAGLPLVGVRQDREETNIVTWSQGKQLMILTLKPDGAVDWNMILPDGSRVFDWNGDGLIDEKVKVTEAGKSRSVRIGGEFYELIIKDGKPYARDQRIERKGGEWSFVE